MKAAVLREFGGTLRVESVELDEPKAGEVRVRVQAVGLCHTDETAREGGKAVPLPIVLGHEGAGIVEQVGPGVRSVRVGQAVVMSVVPSCGYCAACQRGVPALCEVAGPILFGGTLLDGTQRLHQGGQPIHHFFAQSSFAEFAVVPEGGLAPIPDGVPFDVAALVACGAGTGLSTVFNVAQVPPGASVVVLGAGGVGLSVVMAARLAGADPIVVVDVSERKLEWAREFGATDLIHAGAEPVHDAVWRRTGRGADFAFECVGSEATLSELVELIGPGGQAFMIGAGPVGTHFRVDSNRFLFGKRLQSVVGGLMRPKIDIPRFLRLYQRGVLPLDRLITHRWALEEINAGFHALQTGEAIRGVVVFQ